MVGIYKRGKKLYIQYTLNGKRIQRSTGLEDTPANRRMLKAKVVPELMRKISAGEIGQTNVAQQLMWYANNYLNAKEHLKTWRDLFGQVERVIRRFGDRRIDTIKSIEIEQWLTDIAHDTSPRNARAYLGILRALFKMAIRHEHMTHNPCDVIELPRQKRKDVEPFTPQEVAAIVNEADGWLKNYLAVAFYTGMRPGEIFGLMKSDIDTKLDVIHIKRAVSKGKLDTPKTDGSIRSVPIFTPLKPYIIDQLNASRHSLFLFPSDSGGHRYGYEAVAKRWRKILLRLNIPYRKPYATRHTFITSMLQSGEVSVLELAQMVGHATSEMIVKNYARYIKGEKAKVANGFDPFLLTN